MTRCPTAPSHYSTQYWLLISEDLWHSHESNFKGKVPANGLYNTFENYTFKKVTAICSRGQWVNTLRPRRNEHFADDIFKRIFFNENVWISTKISLKFVPKGPINNILALIRIMAWRRPGDKPLSEPMMVSLPTHICVTRPQWVKTLSVGEYLYADSGKFMLTIVTHAIGIPGIQTQIVYNVANQRSWPLIYPRPYQDVNTLEIDRMHWYGHIFSNR